MSVIALGFYLYKKLSLSFDFCFEHEIVRLSVCSVQVFHPLGVRQRTTSLVRTLRSGVPHIMPECDRHVLRFLIETLSLHLFPYDKRQIEISQVWRFFAKKFSENVFELIHFCSQFQRSSRLFPPQHRLFFHFAPLFPIPVLLFGGHFFLYTDRASQLVTLKLWCPRGRVFLRNSNCFEIGWHNRWLSFARATVSS